MGGNTLSSQIPRKSNETSNETPNFSRPQTPRSQRVLPETAPQAINPAAAGLAIAEPLPTTSLESLSHRRDSGLAASITPDVPLPVRRARIAIADPAPLPTTSPTAPAPRGSRAPSIADAKSIRSQIAPSICSPEDEVLSFKVRSLYDSGVGGVGGSDAGSQISKRVSSVMEEGKRMSRVSRNSFVTCRNSHSGDDEGDTGGIVEEGFAEGDERGEEELKITDVLEAAAIEEEEEHARNGHLRAGGAEDWEDLSGSDVDRYGFINPTYLPSTPSGSAPTDAPPQASRAFSPPKRISTALHLHSTTPQKRSHHLHIRISPFSNPAPEMLRSPLPGVTAALREKENSRAKKWRDMAVIRKRSERGDEGGKGGGCEWGFVTKDPKLISRTWKGIPDCWRAAAWHAFLTASRKKRGIGRGDGELVEMYAEFSTRPSADDVQIDLDVPRTINSHIMFRRRYRGGQRLLFRVLHALSLYFPNMGYVQGMASLAATLLCYYDEETAFVMLIRMFELRGLEKLYQAGFGGLMSALEEFENGWIRGGAVSRKLSNLGIGPTTYGTRWYLTLFNYSMPFPAQLRVWDVFMLLGDPDPLLPTGASKLFSASKSTPSLHAPLGTTPGIAPGTAGAVSGAEEAGFGGTLDILHATSAALIDSMKDIIVRSDFEGAMKVLTSWIPVKDEELLMKVAKSEWKMRKRRRGGGGGAGSGAHPGRASLG